MAFSTFSTLFSRQFLIGFMAAPLAALFILSQVLSSEWLPDDYQSATPSAKVVIVGAAAVFVALLLSGLQYPLLRLLEGYPLKNVRVLAAWHASRMYHWRLVFDELTTRLEGPPSSERTEAARRLSSCFPARREHLLPTELGNVLRAFETHPRRRYGLDGIAIWPRIAMLLSAEERSLVDEAAAGMQFFVNSLVVTLLAGTLIAIDTASNASSLAAAIVATAAVVAATVLLAELFRRWSVDAARRWGTPVRAAFDLHRLELYARLGVKEPTTAAEDQVRGKALNRMLMFGEPIPDEHRTVNSQEEGDGL